MKALPLVALFAVFATCGACMAFTNSNAPTRRATQQYASSVWVITACIGDEPTQYGSGVVVSDHKVLTAAHVVTCPLGLPPTVLIDPGDGVARKATVELVLPGKDIARLTVDEDLSNWNTPISIGPLPTIGDRLCWTGPMPRETYRCGTAEGNTTDFQITIDGFVEHGNSGAALYDGAGRLIGLMAATGVCQTGVYCKGWATSLDAYRWLVP